MSPVFASCAHPQSSPAKCPMVAVFPRISSHFRFSPRPSIGHHGCRISAKRCRIFFVEGAAAPAFGRYSSAAELIREVDHGRLHGLAPTCQVFGKSRETAYFACFIFPGKQLDQHAGLRSLQRAPVAVRFSLPAVRLSWPHLASASGPCCSVQVLRERHPNRPLQSQNRLKKGSERRNRALATFARCSHGLKTRK